MRNYIQKGETLTLAAPYAVSSGGGALIGSIFGVAANDYANGEEGEFQVAGVFDLVRESGASTAWTAPSATSGPGRWSRSTSSCRWPG